MLGSSSDVFRYIDQLPTYSEADCRRLVRGLIEAIAFLHEQRIAHRNIKPTALTPCGESASRPHTTTPAHQHAICLLVLSYVWGCVQKAARACA